MNRRLKQTVRIGLHLCVLAGAVVFLARGMAWRDIGLLLKGAKVPLLLATIALNAVVMLTKSFRLRLLLWRRPSVATCFVAGLAAAAINNLTPFRGGDFARIWMLERHAGVTKSVAAVVFLVERACELLVLSALAVWAGRLVPTQHWVAIGAPLVLAGMIVTMIALHASRRIARSSPPAPSSRLRYRFRHLWTQLESGMRVLDQPSVMRASIVLSFVAWSLEVPMVVLTARAIGLTVNPSLAIIVLVGINLAIALPSVPASAGIFEAGATLVLVMAGVAKDQAVAFGLLYHVVQVVPVTLAGAIVVSRAGLTLEGLTSRVSDAEAQSSSARSDRSIVNISTM